MNRCSAGAMARAGPGTAYHDGGVGQGGGGEGGTNRRGVDGAVVARDCIPRRERVPGGGAGWSDEQAEARGALLGCDLGAQLRIQVLGEVLGEELRIDDEDGGRRGGQQM